MNDVILTQQLSKRFGGRTVVDRLDLAVPQGAIFALLGDNGAGKSTTIRMLTGLLPPDGGQARILGQDCYAAAISLRLRVGYVPERPRFYDWMTVEEIGWFTGGFHLAGYLRRYLELVERFHLDRRARLRTLSKGGYAKIGLALALASDPEVLILDEPTSGLDLFTRREFLTSMAELAGEGRTILLSSHAINEVERVASHVAFLANGKLLLSTPIEEVRKRIVRVRLRATSTPPDPAGLGTVLEHEVSGPAWQVVLRDPNRLALEGLRRQPDIANYEENVLSLEEIYTALLASYHHAPVRTLSANGKPPARETAPQVGWTTGSDPEKAT